MDPYLLTWGLALVAGLLGIYATYRFANRNVEPPKVKRTKAIRRKCTRKRRTR